MRGVEKRVCSDAKCIRGRGNTITVQQDVGVDDKVPPHVKRHGHIGEAVTTGH